MIRRGGHWVGSLPRYGGGLAAIAGPEHCTHGTEANVSDLFRARLAAASCLASSVLETRNPHFLSRLGSVSTSQLWKRGLRKDPAAMEALH